MHESKARHSLAAIVVILVLPMLGALRVDVEFGEPLADGFPD